MDIQERKAFLKAEIERAENNLGNKMKSIKVTNYLFPSANIITDLTKALVNKPDTTIQSLDSISRQILPKDNRFRSILKYLNVGLNYYRQLFPQPNSI